MDPAELMYGARELLREAARQRVLVTQRIEAARGLARKGRLSEAVAAYQTLVRGPVRDAGAWQELASLHLAPVQCVAWGHSVTTGLPTIGYFLSSDLMEPADAETHYAETLVRLPGIGIHVAPPGLEQHCKTRADFGLGVEDRVYLSPQAPFKYLPEHDDLFPRVATQVPRAKFVFLRRASSGGAFAILERRLVEAFARHGLDGRHFLVFLPAQHHQDYLALNLAADVFLDQPGWSGGMTALEALGCGLPVVTWPGPFMRGRHSTAFLRQLGLEETIASSLDRYVHIAVRLGIDERWRDGLHREVIARRPRLFNDSTSVPELERFYARVVARMA